MVAIGRALVGAPRLLVLDEPSLGLAPVVTRAVFEALAEVAKQTPLLLVEQNSTMALRVCTRVFVMVGGRFVMSGAASEIDSRQELLRSYLGQRDEAVEEAGVGPVAPQPTWNRQNGPFADDTAKGPLSDLPTWYRARCWPGPG